MTQQKSRTVNTSQKDKVAWLGFSLARALPVPDAECFAGLLAEIDEAAERRKVTIEDRRNRW